MKTKQTSGFSLVEVMVAILIGSIVMGTAYAIWSRVRREVSKSSARQTLQHELRQAMDTLSRDLKAIKTGTMKAPAAQQSADGTRAHFEFERFTESSAGKLAENTTEKVVYDFKVPLLTRIAGPVRHILSTHLDSIELTRGVNQTTLETKNVESGNKDLDRALNARLDLALTGKMRPAGSRQFEYHVERSSVVMRDEYQKTVNSNYLSTNDVAQIGKDKVVVAGANSNFLDNLGSLTEEQLKQLSSDQLNTLEASQQNMLSEAKKSITDMNDNIKSISTGGNLWDTLSVGGWPFGSSDVAQVTSLQSAIKSAEKKEDLVESLKATDGWIKDKEKKFIAQSFSGVNVDSLSEDERARYQKVYDMKVMDRLSEAAYQEALKKDPNAKKPESALDGITRVPDRLPADQEAEQQYQGRVAEAAKLREIASKASLDWMGEPKDESKEVKSYNAAKSIYNYGQAKMQLLGMRDDTQDNLTLINKVKGGG
ncbi:MAG: prepilin-type N-terminal cleavage/methylation domain-containing protein [Candidatus Riflebacteria bacterium]|nr:prepilin-type N-terminal cleavage/methylation domain-containing protein [Candidatus Riflebacteria bacterium]